MNEAAQFFLTCAACLSPILIVGGAVGFFVYRLQRSKEGVREVAEALNLRQTVQFKQVWWYEGKLSDGRQFAIIPISFVSYSYNHEGRRRRVHKPAVRLVLEVLVDRPLDIYVGRAHSRTEKKYPLDSFDTAFRRVNDESLSGSIRQAMTTFAKQNPGTFILRDRHKEHSEKLFYSAEVMGSANAVLLHEYRTNKAETESVRQKAMELVRIAQQIERDVRRD